MNFKRFGSLLPDNPLCGISTYKDTLNLATGVCTRKIKKLVLTGNENWALQSINQYDIANFYWTFPDTPITTINYDASLKLSTHFVSQTSLIGGTQDDGFYINSSSQLYIRINKDIASTTSELQNWLREQYNNNTPVVVWFVLAEATTETITVPTGLSGTEEGYLTQATTPTPTNPIYPTANTVEKWFDLNHYIHTTATDTLTTLPADLYADGTNATVGLKGNMQQTGTPTSQTPIQPSECGDLETSGAKAGQYKIPILNNSQTTNVYLGEVQTTRKIKKLVLTGEEEWQAHPNISDLFRFDINDYLFSESNITLCTHYKSIANTGGGGVSNNETCFYYGTSTARLIYIRDGNMSTASDFKAYLQQQYANGTPVTIWYVLATPTTGIVNEPIRKIGGYADTVSGITIPTITGKDTVDVETTLKPSEVSLNYTGWHDASVKEKSENLFDISTAVLGKYIDSYGVEQTSASGITNHSDYIEVQSNTAYSVSLSKPSYDAITSALSWYDSNKNFLYRDYYQLPTISGRYSWNATSPNNAKYCILNFTTYPDYGQEHDMLNTGSTALPYEPYWK